MIPALLTSASMRRCRRVRGSTCSRTAASSVMSSGTTWALPPLRVMARTVASSSFTVRPAQSTVAPAVARVSAMSRPSPRDAPVSSTTRFFIENRSAMRPPCSPVLLSGAILAYERHHEISGRSDMATSGKVAIVTGSATGLGAECAIDLAGRGWHLVINYTKSKKEADETFAAVKAKGAEAILVQADVGQDADCKKLIDETMKKWGRVDGLINNAGTTKFQNQGDLDGVTPEDFDKILRVNVPGPYMMSRAAYPVMKKQWEEKQERGSIVNISSIAGVMGVGSSIPYACSKGALNTLTLTLARWFSPAVRVNTVCPGFIQTRWLLGGMGEVNYNKMKEMQEQTTPLRQAGTTAQMAEAVLFFLTSASNITGEFLIVDAGMHLASLPMKAR